MKTSLAVIASAVLALSACSGGDSEPTKTATKTQEATSSSEPTKAKTADAKPSKTSDPTPVDEFEYTTTDYLDDTWAAMEAQGDSSTGMTCLLFRSEDSVEAETGPEVLLDNIEAEFPDLDREEARDWFDEKCPTAEEFEERGGN